MLPDDDYLRLKPARRDNAMILMVALMALGGCLVMLSVLVAQA